MLVCMDATKFSSSLKEDMDVPDMVDWVRVPTTNITYNFLKNN
jgi:hypothetical protein